ncbi:hypothetical protein ETU09_05850 [Apibacter muscae]|uniref:HTH psq-type domain-containing protein n=1 Tax=Apibacter muscae TaxID=2509004 RepID=A0A563DEE8_9FLAO|nr:hypothetical protein [Apibacter muscae]TWP28447.1 hypothetical protein ETU09_05850 [Apibacter muscae]
MKTTKNKRMSYSDITSETKKKVLDYYLNNSNNSIPDLEKKFNISQKLIHRIIEEGRKEKQPIKKQED